MVLFTGTIVSAQLKTPTDWRWRTDSPARVGDDAKTPDSSWYYVAMPPGWHVTTRPGVLLYHPDHRGHGLFSLESEIFLFPGESQEGYGLFVGGQEVEGEGATPSYVAFVVRRDGAVAVVRHRGGTTEFVRPWTTNAAVVPHPGGDETAKNVLRLDVRPTAVELAVNGQAVLSVPRDEVATEGRFGFRLGANLNVHITTLDATYRLAPPRAPRR
jgi:hypothetical protein